MAAYLSLCQARRRPPIPAGRRVFCFGLMAKPMIATLPIVLLALDLRPLRRRRVARAGAETINKAGVQGPAGRDSGRAATVPVGFAVSPDPGKSPALCAHRGLLHRHFLRAAELAGRGRLGHLVAVPDCRTPSSVMAATWARCRPRQSGGDLSASAGRVARVGVARFRLAFGGHHGLCAVLGEETALSARRLDLVHHDPGSGHRPRTGRQPGDGGSITYLPSIGMSSWWPGVRRNWRRNGPARRWQGPSADRRAGLLMVVGTHVQASCWKDGEALYSHALAVTRNNYELHCCLGRSWRKRAGSTKRKGYRKACTFARRTSRRISAWGRCSVEGQVLSRPWRSMCRPGN